MELKKWVLAVFKKSTLTNKSTKSWYSVFRLNNINFDKQKSDMMFWVLCLQGVPPVWVLQLVGLVLVQITRVLWLRWAIVLMRHVFFWQKKQETFRDGNLGVLFGDFLVGFLGSFWGCSSTRVIKQTKFNMLEDYWPSCAQEATKI